MRLEQQMAFVIEVDKLKRVLRQTPITGGSRRENSAEHSWHIALMAAVLAEYSKEPIDVSRVVMMLLIHDVVEVDAGDTFLYDEQGAVYKAERERKAAERIFGLLPEAQGARFRALFEEFEARQTPEARYAASIDRLNPILLNYLSGGLSWKRHKIVRAQVEEKCRSIEDGSPELWRYAEKILDSAVVGGFLEDTEMEN